MSFRDGPQASDVAYRGRRIVRGIATAAAVVTSLPAVAQPVPRLEIDVRALASANPLLLPGSDREAILLEATARPGIRFENSSGSSLDVGAEITHRGYTRQYGDFLVGHVDVAGEYRDSEYITVNGYASVARDVAIDLLTDSVESAVEPTSVRTAYVGRASVTWHPDEYSWVQPVVGIERFNFDRSDLLGDTRSVNASLAYRRRFSPNATFGARGGAISSRTTRLSTTRTYFLYATMDQRLSAGWRLTGEIGAERNGARTETLLGIGAWQPSRTRLSGQAQLCREAPAPAICVTVALNSEVSGLGGLQRRAVVTASLDKRLDERTTLALDVEYQRTVMQGELFPEFDAIRVELVAERAIGQDRRLGTTLQYLRRRLVDGSRIGAVLAGIRLTFSPSLR